jgi:Thrombospondin type 3 repeat
MSNPSGRYDASAGPLPVGILPKFGRGATRRPRPAWIVLVAAGLAIVCSSAGAQTWVLGQDLLAHTNATRANFNRFSDSQGNPDVWHLMAASGLARNPSTYARIDLYRRDQCVAGLDYWGALGRPFGGDLGINWNANPINCVTQVVPEHKPLAHPDPDNVVLYGWKSPIAGTVSISGGISDADPGCGNGVDWYVAQGSADIASGSIANGGAQALPPGLAATVGVGEFLYFIIDPKGGDHSCDLTVVDVTIASTVADRDGDGVEDGVDNCPDAANPGQENTDQDELGDVCDPDDDNDGVADTGDNCPLAANTVQEDNDNDGQGDACDSDDDNDGIADGADNCPVAANPAQENNDGDGQGDACDPYTFGFFRPPVDNPPVVNTGRAGRTYPIKFQIFDAAGNYVTSLSAVTSIKFKAVSCGAFAGDPSDALETTAAGATELRYDPVENQFVYNWKTPANAGCYELFVTLADGGVHSANFNLR